MLTRLELPDEGLVSFDGLPLEDHDVLALRRRVQFVAQRAVILTDLVLDELRLGAPELTEDEAEGLLKKAALPRRYLRRSTAGLSGGETQRLCFARALALRPEVLILDEPTSALDTASAAAIIHTVREFVTDGGTVVLVSHDPSVIEALAEDRLALRRGTIDDGEAVLGKAS
jgi:putative ABC transport system ATP-binding protein